MNDNTHFRAVFWLLFPWQPFFKPATYVGGYSQLLNHLAIYRSCVSCLPHQENSWRSIRYFLRYLCELMVQWQCQKFSAVLTMGLPASSVNHVGVAILGFVMSSSSLAVFYVSVPQTFFNNRGKTYSLYRQNNEIRLFTITMETFFVSMVMV